MRRHIDPATLDAVLISHMHADHMLDLVPLRYLLWLGETQRGTPLDVYVHPGATARMHALGASVPSSEGKRFFEKTMRIREYDPDAPLTIGDLTITFARTVHYIDAYAMRVTDGVSTITYSADTAPCPQVVELARDTGIFICECALGPDGCDANPRGHCNAMEAGTLAQSAGARHLILTHYGSEFRPDELHRAASTTYAGPITVADDGLTLSV